MAKRFTDTDKWKKQFIKTLPVEYKLFWLYLLDECDHAGIWHVELDLAEMRLGIQLSTTRIRGLFKEKVVEFDNETKWFIPDFISFQYGKLDERNRAHKSVIDKLSKYNLINDKGDISPLQGAKDKAQDKDMDKDKEPPGENLKESNLFRQPKIPTKNEVMEVFSRNGGTKEMAKSFWEKYEATGWFLNGSPITNISTLASRFITNWNSNDLKNGRTGNQPPDLEVIKMEEQENDRIKAILGIK